MATPLYNFLKQNGVSQYAMASSTEDISASFENVNTSMNFTKFVLLNLDLSKMNLDNSLQFNTESTKIITNKGELLINSLRNYTANQDVVIRESLLNNNDSFYNPNELRTVSERIFWKWLRKSGALQFEPAIPSVDYNDGQDFTIDENLPHDYFKEYIWKEREVIPFNLSNIEQLTFDSPYLDTFDNQYKDLFKIIVNNDSNIKPNDRITIKNLNDNINIGFKGNKDFSVLKVETDNLNNTVKYKNNIVYILSDIPLVWNNFASATLELIYKKVVQYIGEISQISNVQNKDRNYTEINAFIPDQTGKTPTVLFRLRSDSNYSPGLQYPIIPSQDQPEIVGGEQLDSPINTNPTDYPGDQYAYFDVDQKYQNSTGLQDRKSGDYYGIFDTDRTNERINTLPYCYPEFDGVNLDGTTLDFDLQHYTKASLPNQKSNNFDEFNAQTFNSQPPSDFEFNVIMWFNTAEDLTLTKNTNETITTSTTTDVGANSTIVTNDTTRIVTKQEIKVNQDKQYATNLYAISILNNVDSNGLIPTYPKYVSNGKQDGLSYQFNLNMNFHIADDNAVESFDEEKIYSLFGFELYNEVMRKVSYTNSIYTEVAVEVMNIQQEVENLKSLLYAQTDITTINNRIDNLNKLLLLYQRNQIVSTSTIQVEVDYSTSPPALKLNSIDSGYGQSYKLTTSLMYNPTSNTVVNNKIAVPTGKDFLVNIINDDNVDIVLDNNLNVVLDRDLSFKQSCVFKIYPKSSKFNKKLNISILTSLVSNIDNIKGYQLLRNINLPIDTNLNPNKDVESINTRWNSLPKEIYPEKISIRKISSSYYLVLEMRGMVIGSFQTGDVLLLENMKFVYTSATILNPIVCDVSGQYTILGDIVNNELLFQINDVNFINLYTNLIGSSPTKQIDYQYIVQPAYVAFNAGYSVKITNNDNTATSITDKYLIEIEKIKKEV